MHSEIPSKAEKKSGSRSRRGQKVSRLLHKEASQPRRTQPEHQESKATLRQVLLFTQREMERVAVQKVMESVRHPPALYWAVVSAAALCWGTSALAKRGKRIPRNRASPGIAFKRLRRKYAVKIRPFLEDVVYLTMALINTFFGAFYWILDCFHEGRPPPNKNYFPVASVFSKDIEPNLRMLSSDVTSETNAIYKPRRGAIMRLRTRLVKINSLRGRRQTCGCWGWMVEDLMSHSDSGLDVKEGHGKHSQEYESSIRDDENDDPSEESEISSGISLEGEEEDSPQPRWSECHCPECALLLMPMSLATGNLYVRTLDDYVSGKERCTDLDGQETNTNLDLSKEGSTFTYSLPTSAPGCTRFSDSLTKDCTAVIFIHGLFSSSTFWFDTNVIPSLSDAIKSQHRILVPDLLGCGRSPRPIDSLYTLTDQVEAIERSVIQRHGLQSFHLVGHSMGSIVSLALAARCPERVRSITLIAPVYPPGCLHEDGQLAQLPCDAFFSFLNPFTLKGIRALTVCKYYNISRLLGHMFYSKHTFWVSVIHGLLKRYPRSFINDYLTNYHDAAWHITHNTLLAGTHAVIPALKKLQASGHQILVIHGKNDSSIQFGLAEEMSHTFSNVELIAVPGKGHVDVVWGRDQETKHLIGRHVLAGDTRWSRPK